MAKTKSKSKTVTVTFLIPVYGGTRGVHEISEDDYINLPANAWWWKLVDEAPAPAQEIGAVEAPVEHTGVDVDGTDQDQHDGDPRPVG